MKKKIIFGSLISTASALLFPGIVSAYGEQCGANGINTAIGCIPILGSNPGTGFMAWLLRWATGIGSGIAFLLILYGGFMVMTSQGNPERIKVGQELITSAISGLLLIILSIFLLKAIGIQILNLQLFGFGQ